MWVYVCVYAHTHPHTAHMGHSVVSPGVGMGHLEGPKNPDGLNLGVCIRSYNPSCGFFTVSFRYRTLDNSWRLSLPQESPVYYCDDTQVSLWYCDMCDTSLQSLPATQGLFPKFSHIRVQSNTWHPSLSVFFGFVSRSCDPSHLLHTIRDVRLFHFCFVVLQEPEPCVLQHMKYETQTPFCKEPCTIRWRRLSCHQESLVISGLFPCT